MVAYQPLKAKVKSGSHTDLSSYHGNRKAVQKNFDAPVAKVAMDMARPRIYGWEISSPISTR